MKESVVSYLLSCELLDRSGLSFEVVELEEWMICDAQVGQFLKSCVKVNS